MEENKNCSCGHDHNHEHCDCEHDNQTMTLVLDDNQEVKCSVLGIFDVEDKEYIALLPIGEDEVLLYQYSENEDSEDFNLTNIETDEEFAAVEEAFFNIFDSEDFDDDEEYEYEDDEDDEIE